MLLNQFRSSDFSGLTRDGTENLTSLVMWPVVMYPVSPAGNTFQDPARQQVGRISGLPDIQTIRYTAIGIFVRISGNLLDIKISDMLKPDIRYPEEHQGRISGQFVIHSIPAIKP